MRKILFFSVIILLYSCSQYPKDVERALKLAGDNRAELERVLEHYRARPEDSLKYRAACYLIANMSGHYSWDTLSIYRYRVLFYGMDSLLKAPGNNQDMVTEQWNLIKVKYPMHQYLYHQSFNDIRHITGDFLTSDIDAVMDTWQANPYRDSIGSDLLFEYVLPYRKWDGIALEDWRSYFHHRHFSYLQEQYPRPVKNLIDSLLFRYSHFTHIHIPALDYPFMGFEDLLLARRSECEPRCWFNTMLLASVGIPAAVDFAPYWGNRNNGHSWNSIHWGGTFEAIEPFWDVNRWKYKQLFNNRYEEDEWGKFRIPKIYRYTHKLVFEGPGFDKRVDKKDVPPFFKGAGRMDVSKQYFEVSDIQVALTTKNTGDLYVYLCVFNNNQWVPVQWGKCDGRDAVFKDMGCDLLYLPAYCRGGQMIPAAPPFIIDLDGNIRQFAETGAGSENIMVRQTSFERPSDTRYGTSLVGSRLQGANRPDFSDAATLAVISEPVHFCLKMTVDTTHLYKYVRFVFPDREIVYNRSRHSNRLLAYGNIAELIFRDIKIKPADGVVIHSDGITHQNCLRAFDKQPYTSMSAITMDSIPENRMEWIGMDFECPTRLKQIEIMPKNDDTYLFYGATYELCYWHYDQWIPIGNQKAENATLTFRGVPEGALLLLRSKDLPLRVRPFTYENGKQVWW